jgi:hypothetical protein
MTNARFVRLALACLCAAAALLLIGCEEKVTIENYDQIQVGMSKSDVEDLLGSGRDETSAAGGGISSGGLMTEGDKPDEVWVWESSDGAEIVVTFAEGKVVLKRQKGLE